ncbi:MAG: hypothetical protein ABI151_16110 [Chitinophagaceae bacterium]
MKQVKKIMFVMIASLSTMSLFSFRSANTNEQALKNVPVTAYAALNPVNPGDPVQFTGAIIRTIKKVLTANSKEIIVRVLTSIILTQGTQQASVDVRSQSLLSKL